MLQARLPAKGTVTRTMTETEMALQARLPNKGTVTRTMTEAEMALFLKRQQQLQQQKQQVAVSNTAQHVAALHTGQVQVSQAQVICLDKHNGCVTLDSVRISLWKPVIRQFLYYRCHVISKWFGPYMY